MGRAGWWLLAGIGLLAVGLLLWSGQPDEASPVPENPPAHPHEPAPQLLGTPPPDAPPAGAPTDEASARPTPSAPPFRFRVLTGNGAPVAGARIRTVPPRPGAPSHRETNADGRLQWPVANAGIGVLRVVVEAPGYASTQLHADRDTMNEVRLDAADEVEGFVRQSGSDVPVAGATVRAFAVDRRRRPEIGRAVVSDAHGRFVFPALPRGQRIFIVARAPQWHAAHVVRTFPSAEALVLRVAGGGTFAGRVLRADGQPLAETVLWLLRPDRVTPGRFHPGQGATSEDPLGTFYYPRVVTDDLGRFAITGIPLGQPRLPVVKLSDRAEIVAEPITLTAEQPAVTRDLVVPALGAITYRVLDADGRPHDGTVQVDVRSPRVFVRAKEIADRVSGADGWFTLNGLAPGAYELNAWIPPDSTLVTRTVEVPSGEVVRVEFAVPSGGEIKGVVVDVEGTPLEAAGLSWWDGSTARSGATDAKGRFVLRNVPDTAGQLSVEPISLRAWHPRLKRSGPPLAPETLQTVRAGGKPLRIVLHPSGTLTGRLEGLKPGTTSVRYEIFSTHVTGRGSQAVDAQGRFSRGAPRPGVPFLLKFERAGFAPRYVESKALARGQDLDLGTIVFDQGADYAAVVVNQDDQHVPGARVRLTERFLAQNLYAASDGSFRFTRLPTGRPIWLRVDAANYPPQFFLVRAPTTGQRLRLSAGRLKGRIVDADGKLLVGGNLTVTWGEPHPLDADLDHVRRQYTLRTGEVDLPAQAGMHRIKAWRDGGYERGANVRVEVREGQIATFRLQLKR